MVSPLLALLLAAAPSPSPAPTLVVLDGWVVASFAEGRWSAPERKRICETSWQLYPISGPGEPRKVTCSAEDESAPESVYLTPAKSPGSGQLELSARPPVSPRTPVVLPKDSKLYLDVLKKHLGKKRLGPQIHQLERVDLDGDGTDEVLFVASSRAVGEQSPARPDDWAIAGIRWVEGKTPKILELARHDKTGEQLGPAELRLLGAVDLDGDGRLELILEDRDPWGQSVEVWRFDRGKLSSLAKVGAGE